MWKNLALPHTWKWLSRCAEKNAVLGVLINHVIIMAPPCHKKVPRAAIAVYCETGYSRTFPHPYFLPAPCLNISLEFYVLLTVHLGSVLVNNQLDAQFFLEYIYSKSLHVSSTPVLIIRRINCINTTTGICRYM